ncbi:MAG: polysaccharide deacetylase [Alphaproteobacteria bacterium]|nr:polysaccharide deacetylase [Alphaproteobacteria bacterium]
MLPTQPRYAYSAIAQRPDYSWPHGRRLAAYVAINAEVFAYGQGKGSAIAPPDQAYAHSVYAWRDYGNRVGFWRLIELLDELALPAEAQLNTELYEMAPEIPQALRQRGHEILGHGLTNSEEQGILREELERELIHKVTSAIVRHEGRQPLGWMSPWLSNSPVSLDLLQEAGYRYVMDWGMADDQPFWLRCRAGRLLSMPYPIELNDNRAIVWLHATAAEFADMIISEFDEMLAESRRRPLVFRLSLHPFVIGQAFRLRELRRALRHIARHRDDIWLTRPGEICRHIESLPAGIVPGG